MGMINKITADAPHEAKIIGYAALELNSCVIHAVSKMTLKHETTEMNLPLRLKLIGSNRYKTKKRLNVHHDRHYSDGCDQKSIGVYIADAAPLRKVTFFI